MNDGMYPSQPVTERSVKSSSSNVESTRKPKVNMTMTNDKLPLVIVDKNRRKT